MLVGEGLWLAFSPDLMPSSSLASKIGKIYGVHAGVPSSGALFFLRGGHKYQARFCIIAFLNFKKHRYLVLFNKL